MAVKIRKIFLLFPVLFTSFFDCFFVMNFFVFIVVRHIFSLFCYRRYANKDIRCYFVELADSFSLSITSTYSDIILAATKVGSSSFLSL